MKKKGALALSQIIILVVGIVAFSYAVGGGIGIVSGETIYEECDLGTIVTVDVYGKNVKWKRISEGLNKWECVVNCEDYPIKKSTTLCGFYPFLQTNPGKATPEGKCIGDFQCGTTVGEDKDKACNERCYNKYNVAGRCTSRRCDDDETIFRMCSDTQFCCCDARTTRPQAPASLLVPTGISDVISALKDVGIIDTEGGAPAIKTSDLMDNRGYGDSYEDCMRIFGVEVLCANRHKNAADTTLTEEDLAKLRAHYGGEASECFKKRGAGSKLCENLFGVKEDGTIKDKDVAAAAAAAAPGITFGDKADVWSTLKKLEEPPKLNGEDILQIKKTDEGIFVKTAKGESKLEPEDIDKLKEGGILNLDGTINQDKIKTPPVEMVKHFGFIEVPKGSFEDGILGGATWGVAVWGAIQTLGKLGILDKALTEAASWALGIGVGLGKAVGTWIGGAEGTGWGIGIGIGVSIALFLAMYRRENIEVISFSCQPWDAKTGGDDCEECNKQGTLPCSEYQCRSLGQACELVNKGTDEEQCVWVNRGDVEFPIIEAWEDALINTDDYKYDPDKALSPPERGVIIEYIGEGADEENCVPAFTPLGFGVKLDEPGKCKIDILRKESFDDMNFYFSGGLSKYEHSYTMSLPGSSALGSENITIENDGEYELYVRCQDANGNSNTANFVFKFCVEKGPDTTPPLIVETDPLNNMPFGYNKSEIKTWVSINEPAECRWSHSDQSYDSMENDSVHQMDCSLTVFEMNAQGLYTCETTLTGLKDRVENRFYFRCKDQPQGVEESKRNVNTESYKFSLIGTQPLVIDWVKPENGSIIKDSTESVKVTLEAKTSFGYKEGEATCEFGDPSDRIADDKFSPPWAYKHSYDLWLEGSSTGISYEYFIRCCDLGNNCDTETLNFEVETDLDEPIVVRAYHEDTYLKLITDEPAICVYDTKFVDYPCDYSFDDGTPMTTIDEVNHYTDWNTGATFYIICQDDYGKQPSPNECSKIIRPFEFY